MANFTAQDVKRLREETDAPMMECKGALVEANGDFDRAKEILREKGKAAAAKRSERSTAAGVVAIASSADGKTAGGVVLECETDFVARNQEFIDLANELAQAFLANAPGDDPLAVPFGDGTVGAAVEGAVAKIRENIKLANAVRVEAEGQLGTYVHHDRTKGAIVDMTGEGDKLVALGETLAIQVVALGAQVVSKADLSQEILDREMELETQRAKNEGKPDDVAQKIAAGRVNKEFVKGVVLLEQEYFRNDKLTVAEFLQSEGGATPKSFVRLTVGGN